MLVRRLAEQLRVLAALSGMRSERRENACCCGQKLPGQPSSPTGPGGLGCELCRAPPSPPAEPPQADAQRVVQPNDRVSPRPDQVAHRSLVAVGHPPIAGNRRGRPLTQDGQRRRAELRAEVQGVKLHVGNVKGRGKVAREGRLARSRPADDDDPLAACERVHWIPPESLRRELVGIRVGCGQLPIMSLGHGGPLR